MKKLLLLITAGILTLSMVACSSKENGEEGKTDATASEFANTLVVGAPELTGSYISGWGNSAYDNWVKELIHGYETYSVNRNGEFILNEPVISNVDIASDEAGNKTFTFTLQDGLVWSDDTPVTASDYAFQLMISASPELAETGAQITGLEGILGFAEYSSGESKVFKGVNVVDDKTFSLTIAAENLPYFYEAAYASVGLSMPKHVIDPEGELLAVEGGGTEYVGDLAAASQFVFNTYRFNPTATVGPYKFVSLENNTATVELNPKYVGNFEGKKPTVEKIIVKTVNQTLDADLVIQGAENGGIDIAAGIIEGDKIEKIKASEEADYNTYFRNGYGYLAFHTDFGASANANVRKAVAYIMDRNAFIQNVVGGYGTVINGDFGLSQWMYQEKQAEVEEKLVNYTYNIEKANELLDETEWVYEADGTTPWDVSKAAEGYYRHNSAGEVLELNHAGTTENIVTDTIAIEIPKGAAQVGLKFTIEQVDFDTLLNHFWKGAGMGEDRRFNTFNLAVTFSAAFDPFYTYHSSFVETSNNATKTNDPKMDAIVEKLRAVDPTDKETYANLWLEYQTVWNEYLPQIPLYANQYFDIFNNRVSGVTTAPGFSWAAAVCDIRLGE
ncbi:MAG: ABC transporter substrate-binding protein [Anaerorhabdus sp.]